MNKLTRQFHTFRIVVSSLIKSCFPCSHHRTLRFTFISCNKVVVITLATTIDEGFAYGIFCIVVPSLSVRSTRAHFPCLLTGWSVDYMSCGQRVRWSNLTKNSICLHWQKWYHKQIKIWSLEMIIYSFEKGVGCPF